MWDACEDACKNLLGEVREGATTDATDFLLRVCGQFKDLPPTAAEIADAAQHLVLWRHRAIAKVLNLVCPLRLLQTCMQEFQGKTWKSGSLS